MVMPGSAVAHFTQEMRKRFPAAQVNALLEEVRGFANEPNPERLMRLLARQK
ncbi:MAG: hypothetical protein Q8K18_15340 [Burkholderiales bacterium]|nr:hypothetical protein [Burkholderiales bacterium]